MTFFISFLFFFSSFALFAKESSPYLAYLKSGTILTKLSDQSNTELTQGIYANVLAADPSRGDLFFVYDKKGKAIYETTASGIVQIENDFKILPQVSAQVQYPPPETFKRNDTSAFFNTQFNFHLDQFQNSSLVFASKSIRYEARTFFMTALPLNVGLGINYQTANWNDEFENKINLSIFSFGPQIEHVFYKKEALEISAFFGAEFAPVYQIKAHNLTTPEILHFKALIYDLGAEGTWSSKYGNWSLGTHYRRHQITLNSSSLSIEESNLRSEEISFRSIGFMIGYKYPWNL